MSITNLTHGQWTLLCIIGVIALIILATDKTARDFAKTGALIAIAWALVKMALK